MVLSIVTTYKPFITSTSLENGSQILSVIVCWLCCCCCCTLVLVCFWQWMKLTYVQVMSILMQHSKLLLVVCV